MIADTVKKEWTAEEWARLNGLLYDRIRSRLWLMHETLDLLRTERCGEGLEVCATTLEGVYFIVDDMLEEINEATALLDL